MSQLNWQREDDVQIVYQLDFFDEFNETCKQLKISGSYDQTVIDSSALIDLGMSKLNISMFKENHYLLTRVVV